MAAVMKQKHIKVVEPFQTLASHGAESSSFSEIIGSLGLITFLLLEGQQHLISVFRGGRGM